MFIVEGIKGFYRAFEIILLYIILRFFGVKTHHFGKGKAKKLSDLLREIKTGDCELITSKSKLHRTVYVVRAGIFYKNLILKEVKQVFSDNREDRIRGYLWVSEKKSIREKNETALKRAVKEELGIHSDLDFSYILTTKEIKESPSYPGLPTVYNFLDYKVVLTDEQFEKDGYIEDEGNTGLITFFEWVENTESN